MREEALQCVHVAALRLPTTTTTTLLLIYIVNNSSNNNKRGRCFTGNIITKTVAMAVFQTGEQPVEGRFMNGCSSPAIMK